MNNLSEGQSLALTQLKTIESGASFDMEILNYAEYDKNKDFLLIDISINMRGFEKTKDGFDFRPRERMKIYIHKKFPFEIPIANFYDFRYLGKSHVQWGEQICLYQSIESDFDPSDGMFGFMDRLLLWLKNAAKGTLDPIDAPMHPPVAYKMYDHVPKIIPNSDTPSFEKNYWMEACAIKKLNDSYVITNWLETINLKRGIFYGAVLLTKNNMPFEFPFTLNHLLSVLKKNQINEYSFLQHIGQISLINGKGTSLFIVIGTPMRGLVSEKKQHLAVWYLEEEYTKSIRTLFGNKVNNYKTLHKVQQHAKKLDKFSNESLLTWCEVLENRQEIILSRDNEAQINLFKNKRIEIWGCGALGSHVAEIAARAKAKEIILVDNGIVKPGLISRQLFYERNIGENKAIALKERIEEIYTELYPLKVKALKENVLNHLENINTNEDVDFIIDTTASQRVLRKIDKFLIDKLINIPVIVFTINNNAKRAMALVRPVQYNSGLLDIIRKAKLKLCDDNKPVWLSSFFPRQNDTVKLIQPEPGCSDPTFIGSEADLSILTGLMMNSISSDLSDPQNSKVHFISQEIQLVNKNIYEKYTFPTYSKELILKDNINQYKIYINQNVIDKIKEEILNSDKNHNPPHETGGLLFGEWDELSKIVYLNDISAAPNDSKSSPNHFECGTEGTKELSDKLKIKFRSSMYFVGLWHSHPFGSSQYSDEDKKSMQLVVTRLSPPKSLLLITAYNKDEYYLGGFVFNKSQF